jgi:hypothetical protein
VVRQPVARYHFNLVDGKEYPDEQGTELPDLASAREEALRILSDFIRQDVSDFWGSRMLTMTVTNSNGLSIQARRDGWRRARISVGDMTG